MRKYLFILLSFLILASSAFGFPPQSDELPYGVCTNGQLVKYNTTTMRWDTCADSIAGNAATATALAANGTNCTSGQAPLGVDASGAVEGCYAAMVAGVTNVTETGLSATCNWTLGNTCYVTAQANTTAWSLTLSNPIEGQIYRVYVKQATGGPVPLPTIAPVPVWIGSAPTFAGTNNKHDAFTCQWVNSVYYCSPIGNNF